MTVLNWMSELPKHEVPPPHLWADGDGLGQWWAKVEEKRAEGSSPASGSASSSTSDEGTGNDLAQAFRK